MQVFNTIAELRQYLSEARMLGKSIGLVPTMGALHQGHLSLLSNSKLENEVSVCSIYVNPTQFDNPHDLAKYPRLLEKDLGLLEQQGCDAVFAPSDAEMYPSGTKPSLGISFGELETVMEGKYRTGHFNGVGIVVSKLFHIVQPDRAYFGQKDLQQFAIIRQLVESLSFCIELKRCPIIREKDGLAMSSRNLRLSERERYIATRLYQSLQLAQRLVLEGAPISEIKNQAIAHISQHVDFKVEYFELARLQDLQSVDAVDGSDDLAVCVAAHLGQVRLIDNLIIEKELLPMYN